MIRNKYVRFEKLLKQVVQTEYLFPVNEITFICLRIRRKFLFQLMEDKLLSTTKVILIFFNKLQIINILLTAIQNFLKIKSVCLTVGSTYIHGDIYVAVNHQISAGFLFVVCLFFSIHINVTFFIKIMCFNWNINIVNV